VCVYWGGGFLWGFGVDLVGGSCFDVLLWWGCVFVLVWVGIYFLAFWFVFGVYGGYVGVVFAVGWLGDCGLVFCVLCLFFLVGCVCVFVGWGFWFVVIVVVYYWFDGWVGVWVFFVVGVLRWFGCDLIFLGCWF